MLYQLQRHPLRIRAHFDFSLVLAYAFEREILQPLLPPGLELDTYNNLGFVAIAMVKTRQLRPVGFPRWMGQELFLTGYRIFVKHHDPKANITRRGLRILRSDTNRPMMAFFGNRLTHYNYQIAGVQCDRHDDQLEVKITTPGAAADLHVHANLTSRSAPLPPGSPFPDLQTARHFAGPLPFTFDYERQTHSIISIKGVRENWDPQPVHVDVHQASFFRHPPFDRVAKPVLANAFYLENVPYEWKRGSRVALEK